MTLETNQGFSPQNPAPSTITPDTAAQPAQNFNQQQSAPDTAPGQTGQSPAMDTSIDPLLSQELEYLQKDGGEDVASLRAELEALIRERSGSPAPVQAQQAQQLPGNVSQENFQQPGQQPQQQFQQQTQPAQTAMERALDPYAVDSGQRPAADDITSDVDSIIIGADGKVHDNRTGRYVPHQALHQARETNKQLRQEMDKIREENARAAERVAILSEMIRGSQNGQTGDGQQPGQPGQQQQQAPQLINPEEDIFGAFKQQQEIITALQSQLQESRTATQAEITDMRIRDMYRVDAAQFAAEKPDFPDAFRDLIKRRDRELELLGWDKPAERQKQIAAEEETIIRMAVHQKRSPAKVLYDLAEAKGYTPRTAAQPGQQAAQQQPQQQQVQQTSLAAQAQQLQQQPGQQPMQQRQAQPLPAVDPQAAQRIDNMRQGQALNATLSNSGGTPGEGLTIESLVNMTDDDFQAMAAKVGRRKLDQLLAGLG